MSHRSGSWAPGVSKMELFVTTVYCFQPLAIVINIDPAGVLDLPLP